MTRLATYLNDHLGGATAGVELAKRSRGANKGTELGAFLAKLTEEIDDDRETLRSMMRTLAIGEDNLKKAAGWTIEKVGRLKPNGQLRGYSPLSRLIELEASPAGSAPSARCGSTWSGWPRATSASRPSTYPSSWRAQIASSPSSSSTG